MNKTIVLLAASAALVLAGAGCAKNAAAPEQAASSKRSYDRLTEEQRSRCVGESVSASMNIAFAPEDKAAPARIQNQLEEECLESMAAGRTYHLVRFPRGDESEGIADELKNSLGRPYYILSSCKSAGFAWELAADKSDRRAYYECRTTCAAAAKSDDVACEGTAYASPKQKE